LYGLVIQIYKVGTLTKSIYYGMSDSADHLDRAQYGYGHTGVAS
jgi:hypothetical protein